MNKKFFTAMLFSSGIFCSAPLLASVLTSAPEETPDWVARFNIALGSGYSLEEIQAVVHQMRNINKHLLDTPPGVYSYENNYYQALLEGNHLIFSPVDQGSITRHEIRSSFSSSMNQYHFNRFTAWTNDGQEVQGLALTRFATEEQLRGLSFDTRYRSNKPPSKFLYDPYTNRKRPKESDSSESGSE